MNVKLRPGALREIRMSPRVIADLEARAHRIAQAAGPGMVVMPTEQGPHRPRAAVVTGTYQAMHHEATSRALTSAIDAGR